MNRAALVAAVYDYMKSTVFFSLQELEKISQSLTDQELKDLEHEYTYWGENACDKDFSVTLPIFKTALKRQLYCIAFGNQGTGAGDLFKCRGWKESTRDEFSQAQIEDGTWIDIYTVLVVDRDEIVSIPL